MTGVLCTVYGAQVYFQTLLPMGHTVSQTYLVWNEIQLIYCFACVAAGAVMVNCKCADEKLNMFQQEKDLHTDIVVS